MAARRHRRWPFLLILLAGAAWLLARRAKAQVGAQAGAQPGSAPTWTPVANVGVEAAPAPTWVDAVDGGCPDGYPVKVAASGIFHVPGGRSYERTTAVKCYADPTAAAADGYRQAKA